MSYSKKILYYYSFDENTGEFISSNYVGLGLIGAPVCGDVVRFQILVINNKIIDVKFKTYGCGSAIASSSLLSCYIKNLELYQAKCIKNNYISQELNLPLAKLHCSVLVEEVLNLSISNYKNKYIITYF